MAKSQKRYLPYHPINNSQLIYTPNCGGDNGEGRKIEILLPIYLDSFDTSVWLFYL